MRAGGTRSRPASRRCCAPACRDRPPARALAAPRRARAQTTAHLRLSRYTGNPPMMRRLLILLVCGGLLAATAVAGYALHGYRQNGAAGTLLIQRVDHRLRGGKPQAAHQLLQESIAHGDITGAVLRTGRGRITVVGSTSGLGAATALGHGASVRLATPA